MDELAAASAAVAQGASVSQHIEFTESDRKGSVFSERIPENHQPSSSLPMTYGNVPRVVLALIHDECDDMELYNAQNNTHTSQ